MVRQPDSMQHLEWWCRQHHAVYVPAEFSKVFKDTAFFGSPGLLSSQCLLDTEQGFMQGQEMVVGVHISASEPVGILMHSHIQLICECNIFLACRNSRSNNLCKTL